MQLLQQRHISMKGNMCKTITHMFSMVHALTCVYAMCVNKHCSTHEILCYYYYIMRPGIYVCYLS